MLKCRQHPSPTFVTNIKNLDREIHFERSNLIDLLFILVINAFKLVQGVFHSSPENSPEFFSLLSGAIGDVVTRPTVEFITLEVINLLTFETDRSHRKSQMSLASYFDCCDK